MRKSKSQGGEKLVMDVQKWEILYFFFRNAEDGCVEDSFLAH